MLSILIPTYNYNVTPLCKSIHSQLIEARIPFEILIYEDGSTKHVNKLKDLTFTKVIIKNINIGRIESRNFLSKSAKYDWLLFLDADVIPKSPQFIDSYLEKTTNHYDVIFGGFTYSPKPPGSNHLLRWTYGKSKEQVLASIRNKKPYKVTISANFLIRKALFIRIFSKISKKNYGYDNFFGAYLKQHNIKTLHIDNEVFHLGLDTNLDYIKKSELAISTLLMLYKQKHLNVHENDLLKLFLFLKKIKLTRFIGLIFKLFKNKIKKNLVGTSPSILLFQIYRISYMCYSDINS